MFIPQVPEGIEDGDGEDFTTPRICFSDSIEGCLGSIPDGGRGLREYINRWPQNKSFLVFILDSKTISDGKLVYPDQLHELVPDASVHNEYWVTESIQLKPSFIIDIISFSNDGDKIIDLQYTTRQ